MRQKNYSQQMRQLNMKNLPLILTILICCVLNSFAQKNHVTDEEPCSDEYGIYSAILNQQFTNSAAKQVVVHKFTGGSEVGNSLVYEQRKADLLSLNKISEEELIENYNADHSKPTELEDKFCVASPVVLVTDEDLKPIREASKGDMNGHWAQKAFEKKYGTQGLIKFSRVAFNESKSEALVHVEVLCASVWGDGYIYFLSKKDGKWIVVRRFVTWIS